MDRRFQHAGRLPANMPGAAALERVLQDVATQINTFTQTGAGAVDRPPAEKLAEIVSVNDYASIQEALDTGAGQVVFPAGSYSMANITMTTAGQRLIALGRVIVTKNANGPIITCSAASQGISGFEFQGASASFTGSNVVSSGDFFHFKSGSEDSASYAVDCTGAAPLIEPGPWRIWTADATATGFDIRFLGSGSANLYGRIIATYSSISTGGILLENTGAVNVLGGQFGKLSVKLGAGSSGNTGPTVMGARITGAVVIEQSGTLLGGNKFGSNVTIGDNANAISGIMFGDDNQMQGSTTLTINNLVQGSSFHLGQIYAGAVTVSINSGSLATNDIWHGAIAYTPTFTGGTSNPSVGDGTLAGIYSRNGRQVVATFSFIGGGSTTWGSGAMRFGLPIAIKGSTGVQKIGSLVLVDSSTGKRYPGCTYGSPSAAYMNGEASDTGAAQATAQVADGGPFTFANGDQIYGQLTYDV